MCDCGAPVPHGHFHLYEDDEEAFGGLILGKCGGRRLAELLLAKEMITPEEKVLLEAQVEASDLPETFKRDGYTDLEGAEITFAEEMKRGDPLGSILRELLGGGV